MEECCCRICLSTTQSQERQDLFSEDDKLSVIGQLYEEVLNIPIDKQKISLKFICNSCGLQLKLFKQLKNKALETYSFLIELVNGTLSNDDSQYLEKDLEENKLLETNLNLSDSDILGSLKFKETDALSTFTIKDEYLIDNEQNTPTTEYIDYQDNEQQEIDIIQSDTIEDSAEEHYLNENDIAKSENHQNYLNENDIAKSENHQNVNDILVEIEEHEHDEDEDFVYNSVEELSRNDEPSDEEGYEVSYLHEDLTLENSEDECEQEYDEECLMNEQNTNQNTSVPQTIEIKSFECPQCDEAFKLKSQLKRHKQKKHSTTTKIQCYMCNKVLLSKETFQAHINVHNGLPAYQCNICEKPFNQRVHYTYHMLNHNNERNIVCEICQKTFISTGDLKTHMRCHTDERPYQCDVCDKKFRAHTHMVNHRYSHFEKQFECPECFQKYMSPNTLRTHFKAVHKAEVPFECEFCEKRFKRKHHLQAHYKTHAKVMGNISIVEE